MFMRSVLMHEDDEVFNKKLNNNEGIHFTRSQSSVWKR